MKPHVQVLKSSDDGSPEARKGDTENETIMTSCLNACRCWTWSRAVALRVLFLMSIIVAIVVCSTVSYLKVTSLESEVGRQVYERYVVV
jgi:hypothetical protein